MSLTYYYKKFRPEPDLWPTIGQFSSCGPDHFKGLSNLKIYLKVYFILSLNSHLLTRPFLLSSRNDLHQINDKSVVNVNFFAKSNS